MIREKNVINQFEKFQQLALTRKDKTENDMCHFKNGN